MNDVLTIAKQMKDSQTLPIIQNHLGSLSDIFLAAFATWLLACICLLIILFKSRLVGPGIKVEIKEHAVIAFTKIVIYLSPLAILCLLLSFYIGQNEQFLLIQYIIHYFM